MPLPPRAATRQTGGKSEALPFPPPPPHQAVNWQSLEAPAIFWACSAHIVVHSPYCRRGSARKGEKVLLRVNYLTRSSQCRFSTQCQAGTTYVNLALARKQKIIPRDIGERAERREVIALLQPTVDAAYARHVLPPPRLRLNTNQAAVGGYDIAGLPWLAIEVKHQRVERVGTWWGQATQQATAGQHPILFARVSNGPWMIHMVALLTGGYAEYDARVVVSVEEFLLFLRAEIDARLYASETDEGAGDEA